MSSVSFDEVTVLFASILSAVKFHLVLECVKKVWLLFLQAFVVMMLSYV